MCRCWRLPTPLLVQKLSMHRAPPSTRPQRRQAPRAWPEPLSNLASTARPPVQPATRLVYMASAPTASRAAARSTASTAHRVPREGLACTEPLRNLASMALPRALVTRLAYLAAAPMVSRAAARSTASMARRVPLELPGCTEPLRNLVFMALPRAAVTRLAFTAAVLTASRVQAP